jgi:DNA end-binding protein Ku
LTPIYYDSSHYLAPDSDAGMDVYAVLYEAIEKTGRIALPRVVIARRCTSSAISTTQRLYSKAPGA